MVITCGCDIDANRFTIMFGITPPRVCTEPAGVTLIEPGVSSAISIVEPVDTSELRDPRLRPTCEAFVIESPVPPEIALRWIATFWDPDTDTAVWLPLHAIVRASSTTTPAQLTICTAGWPVEALPIERSPSSTPLPAATFEMTTGPDDVSMVTCPGALAATWRFCGAEDPIVNAA